LSQSQSDGKFGHGYPEFSDCLETKQASCAYRFLMLSLFPHLVQINFQYLCNPVRNLFYVKPAARRNVAIFKLLVGSLNGKYRISYSEVEVTISGINFDF